MQALHGRSILVVEDEPLIALDIVQAFEQAGAEVTTTHTLRHALALIEHVELSAVILDHALGDENSSGLCERLKARGIPFLIYSGFPHVEGPCENAPHIAKPASHAALVVAMQGLLSNSPIV